ncbi:metallophosphoesterase [Pyrodictium occultum]|uniref:metallophosphoesterase n=1 Tax=Pyrodictium occultum TaxID=2309 RepID=UPI0014432C6C|nr:metallophosphoesterase [Pyrodictium occultum]
MAGVAAGVVGLAAAGVVETLAAGVELTRVRLGVGRRVLLLADLHVHGSPGWRAVWAARAARPDLVVLAGDTWDERTRGFGPVWETLREVARYMRAGVAVLGNHEVWAARRLPLGEGVRLLEDAGFSVLLDSDAEVLGLRVAGLAWREDPRGYRGPLERLARGADLVVVHSPDAFSHLPRGARVVVLAGHTHGGQWCLPVNRSVWTNSRYGYAWGLYRRGESVMYVSRGLGERDPPRVFCHYQAVLIE